MMMFFSSAGSAARGVDSGGHVPHRVVHSSNLYCIRGTGQPVVMRCDVRQLDIILYDYFRPLDLFLMLSQNNHHIRLCKIRHLTTIIFIQCSFYMYVNMRSGVE